MFSINTERKLEGAVYAFAPDTVALEARMKQAILTDVYQHSDNQNLTFGGVDLVPDMDREVMRCNEIYGDNVLVYLHNEWGWESLKNTCTTIRLCNRELGRDSEWVKTTSAPHGIWRTRYAVLPIEPKTPAPGIRRRVAAACGFSTKGPGFHAAFEECLQSLRSVAAIN